MSSPKDSHSSVRVTLKSILLNMRQLLAFSWKMDRKTTFIFYAISFLGAFIPIATSYLFTFLIDYIQIAQNSQATVVPIVIVAVLGARYAIYALQDLFYYAYIRTYLDHIYRYKLQNNISYTFYQKVVKLDITHFEDPETQDLITKVKDTMLWRIPDYLRIISYLMASIVTYITAFIVTLQFGWWIPVVVTIVTLPRLYIRAQYGNFNWTLWGGSVPQARRLWYLGYILQDKVSVREMRIFQTDQVILKKLKDLQEFMYDINKKPLDKYMKALIAPPIAEILVLFAITLLFLPDVTSQAMTIGSFSLLLNMLGQLNSNTANAAHNMSDLYENNLYVNQYFELLNLQPSLVSPKNAVKVTGSEPPKIEFRNVSFEYSPGKRILHNVSFIIEPGDSIAFVGHNGAGKSTIIKLLCRFYDVTEGEILINGENIKNIDLQTLYSYMGTLFQEFVWYHLSVKENITLGSGSSFSKKKMIAAAKKAGAHEFISSLPNQYSQLLGKEYENGEELSGGQWQKLAIARAFYQQPSVLILDEPTSAIDAEAEFEIFSNLEKEYSEKKTLILVSHRFSTVRNAHKIIVLEKGKIVESGSHKELLKLNNKYAKMFATQAQGYV